MPRHVKFGLRHADRYSPNGHNGRNRPSTTTSNNGDEDTPTLFLAPSSTSSTNTSSGAWSSYRQLQLQQQQIKEQELLIQQQTEIQVLIRKRIRLIMSLLLLLFSLTINFILIFRQVLKESSLITSPHSFLNQQKEQVDIFLSGIPMENHFAPQDSSEDDNDYRATTNKMIVNELLQKSPREHRLQQRQQMSLSPIQNPNNGNVAPYMFSSAENLPYGRASANYHPPHEPKTDGFTASDENSNGNNGGGVANPIFHRMKKNPLPQRFTSGAGMDELDLSYLPQKKKKNSIYSKKAQLEQISAALTYKPKSKSTTNGSSKPNRYPKQHAILIPYYNNRLYNDDDYPTQDLLDDLIQHLSRYLYRHYSVQHLPITNITMNRTILTTANQTFGGNNNNTTTNSTTTPQQEQEYHEEIIVEMEPIQEHQFHLIVMEQHEPNIASSSLNYKNNHDGIKDSNTKIRWFHKGWLTNVGIAQILQIMPNVDCIIWHSNIALFPKDIPTHWNETNAEDENIATGIIPYHKCTWPTQLSSELEHFRWSLDATHAIGHVVSMKAQHWKEINGIPWTDKQPNYFQPIFPPNYDKESLRRNNKKRKNKKVDEKGVEVNHTEHYTYHQGNNFHALLNKFKLLHGKMKWGKDSIETILTPPRGSGMYYYYPNGSPEYRKEHPTNHHTNSSTTTRTTSATTNSSSSSRHHKPNTTNATTTTSTSPSTTTTKVKHEEIRYPWSVKYLKTIHSSVQRMTEVETPSKTSNEYPMGFESYHHLLVTPNF